MVRGLSCRWPSSCWARAASLPTRAAAGSWPCWARGAGPMRARRRRSARLRRACPTLPSPTSYPPCSWLVPTRSSARGTSAWPTPTPRSSPTGSWPSRTSASPRSSSTAPPTLAASWPRAWRCCSRRASRPTAPSSRWTPSMAFCSRRAPRSAATSWPRSSAPRTAHRWPRCARASSRRPSRVPSTPRRRPAPWPTCRSTRTSTPARA